MINDNENKRNLELLESAINSYEKLIETKYQFLLGHKGVIAYIELSFLPSAFFHLSGINKLSDISINRNVKKAFYRDIKEKASFRERIIKSEFFNRIKSRLVSIIRLENNFKLFETNKYVKFAHKITGEYLSIDYDYFVTSRFKDNQYYYFIRNIDKSKKGSGYVLISNFIENEKDYSVGQQLMTLLRNTLINLKTGKELTIFSKGLNKVAKNDENLKNK